MPQRFRRQPFFLIDLHLQTGENERRIEQARGPLAAARLAARDYRPEQLDWPILVQPLPFDGRAWSYDRERLERAK